MAWTEPPPCHRADGVGADDPRLIMISTHHLPDLERIVDRVLVMESERLVHDIDAGDLEGRFVRITRSTAGRHRHRLPPASVLSRQDMAGRRARSSTWV